LLSREDIDKKTARELAFESWVDGISQHTGIPRDVVEKSLPASHWKTSMEKFLDNKIEHYQDGIEWRKKKIEKYKGLIKKHKEKINWHKNLIKKYKRRINELEISIKHLEHLIKIEKLKEKKGIKSYW